MLFLCCKHDSYVCVTDKCRSLWCVSWVSLCSIVSVRNRCLFECRPTNDGVVKKNNNEPVYFTTKSYIAYREMICLYIKAIICVNFVQ